MRLVTYLLAAALLWAVATTGPASSSPEVARAEAPGSGTAPPHGR